MLDRLCPMNLQVSRDFGIAITGQVDQSIVTVQGKKIDLLGSPGCLAGPGQAILTRDCIQCTGLADVRSSGESDFAAGIIWPVFGMVGRQYIRCLSQEVRITGLGFHQV